MAQEKTFSANFVRFHAQNVAMLYLATLVEVSTLDGLTVELRFVSIRNN